MLDPNAGDEESQTMSSTFTKSVAPKPKSQMQKRGNQTDDRRKTEAGKTDSELARRRGVCSDRNTTDRHTEANNFREVLSQHINLHLI